MNVYHKGNLKMSEEQKELLQSFTINVSRGLEASVEADEHGEYLSKSLSEEDKLEEQLNEDIKYYFRYAFEEEGDSEEVAVEKSQKILDNLTIEANVNEGEPEEHHVDRWCHASTSHYTEVESVEYFENIDLKVTFKDINQTDFSREDIDNIISEMKEHGNWDSPNETELHINKSLEMVDPAVLNLLTQKTEEQQPKEVKRKKFKR